MNPSRRPGGNASSARSMRWGGGHLASSPFDLVPGDFEGLHDCLCLSHCKERIEAAPAGLKVPHESANDYGSNRGLFSIDRHGLPLAAPRSIQLRAFLVSLIDRTRHHRPSRARIMARLSGFLTLSRSRDGPD